MALLNDHYLKLQAGYLFPEIDRRVRAFLAERPDLAPRLIRCGIGDVTEPLPPAVIAALHAGVDDLAQHATFKGYGPATGYDFLRAAIATHDYRERGLDIADDEIFISEGSKIDCGAILDIFAEGTANRIAVADPVYPVYVDTNVMAGHTGPALPEGGYRGLIYLPCTLDNGFIAAPPAEHADIIYLCSPNNPTGTVATHEQLAAWVEYARAHEAVILFDAAYEAFIQDESLPRSIYELPGAETCAVEFRSFSKNGGFTGLRCGFTVMPKTLMARAGDGKRHSLHPLWSRRWATKSNGVSYPVQRAAAALYTEEGRAQSRDLIRLYMSNAARLLEACRDLGLHAYGGDNAPYLWVRCPDGRSSWETFDRLLHEAQVVITPGAGFGRCGEGYFRISAFNSRDNIEVVAERLGVLAPVQR